MAHQQLPDRLPSQRSHTPPGRPGGSSPADNGDTGTSTSMNAEPYDATPPGGGTAGEVLTRYLHERAAAFLRGLSLRGENEAEADALLRGSARRIGGVLHIYGPLTDPGWAEPLRAELGWLTTTLGREPQYAARLARLLDALRRLSVSVEEQEAVTVGGPPPPAPSGGGPLALGAARAGALLERQLTLARTRAHSASLQAMGSARFHALADAIAVLVSDVPLAPAAAAPAASVMPPLAAQAYRLLADAAAALPLHRAAHPYNADAVQASLGADLTADLQDAPWHQVRILLRLSRYAAEVSRPEGDAADRQRLADAATVLGRHRAAAESASAVATAARTPRIAPATAYALGVLHADQRHEVEAARFAFSRLWQPAVPGPRGQ
ncbi:CHAD domain-containing protein [Actinacidiphila cocklensis]|uniref:CHAD domain-containing protein n=2 Tax=Actinacidiphila cocklensis TaxID=887465 RepID=A0A9W4E363_9ACTN|nr:CHAD domain-containing protein [Actinacidiphila cocklensis]